MEAIYTVAKKVREDLVAEYGASNLYGKCIQASESIVEELTKLGITASTVEGWCKYDDDSNCSDRPYDEHTWVSIQLDGQALYLDVTADQFQAFIDEEVPAIILGETPYYMTEEEPEIDD